jgi:type I restriction enzyme R subunit
MDIRSHEGRLGVFWHTQGSGKSVSMMFFAQKVLRKVPGNWTFVVVTDREDLDDWIYKNFASAGVITDGRAPSHEFRPPSPPLTGRPPLCVHPDSEFRSEPGVPHPVLTERSDIIVITDEAHRSQYDTLALNMRTGLPHASFIDLTGTPLISGKCCSMSRSLRSIHSH